jgi:hypothetical protein
MRKLPKSYSYVLWALVFVRLLLPVMPESAWSFLPKVQIEGVNQRIEVWIDDEEVTTEQAGVDKEGISQNGTYTGGFGQPGMDGFNNVQNVGTGADVENGVHVDITENAEPERGWFTILGRVWLVGSALLIGYGLTANVLLEKRLEGAKEMEDGVYEIENLPTAFVNGLLKPRIYLPAGLLEEYRRYVLEHERTHLKRGDVWVKYIAYILISIHWFNPLVWISYVLMCRDMEMSCDERVLQNLGMEEKKAYSIALLAVSSGRKIQLGMPVAFGEHGAKGRIVNVLHYRKPAFWVTAAAGVVLSVLALGLLSDPKEKQEKVITPQFDATFLAQVEEWVDVMGPHHDSSISSRWFEDYTGEYFPQSVEYNGSDIIFYPRVSENIHEVIRKMLGVTTSVPYVELEKYEDRIWLVEYSEDVYLLVQREGVCRLQKYEDMIQYKQKEVELEDVPIYPEDLKDIEILSEKLSYGVNALFLFWDYESTKDFDTVGNCDVVFDYIRSSLEKGMIDHYFDEETYYQVMARKTGQDLSGFKAEYKDEKHPYGRVYDGFRLDAVSGDVVVTDVKWLENSKVEIYYSGWSQEGMAVMGEQGGEMIFVSNSKRFKNEVITPQFDEAFLQQVEEWVDVAAPSNAMGFSNWFNDYTGDRWFEDYTGNEPPMFIEYNDSRIVFYPRGKADISEMLKKMLGVTTTVPFVELEKYKDCRWVAEYNEEAYLLMQWKGICRLQKVEDMMQYKHEKVELKDIPIYSDDLNDRAVLSEKLSQGVNIVYLFRDYTHVNEMNPVNDVQLVFDNIRYQNTNSITQYDAGDIIHLYFDEEVFLEIMAKKAGQDITEFLNGRNLENSWYQRVYKGWSGDSMRMEIEVTEVKWLDDSQAEIYYSGTYWNGVTVMRVHEGEMIFVSNRRIYD